MAKFLSLKYTNKHIKHLKSPIALNLEMQSLVHTFKKMYYYVCMHDMCVDTSATEVRGAQKTALQSRFSPVYDFDIVPGIEFRSLSLCSKQLYPKNYLGDSLTVEVSKLPFSYSDENS